jgi:hypothetical protein
MLGAATGEQEQPNQGKTDSYSIRDCEAHRVHLFGQSKKSIATPHIAESVPSTARGVMRSWNCQ